MKAKIYGIGVGPGDPDLITIKAKQTLAKANLVVYPAPENGSSIAKKIAAPHFPKTCEELPVYIPMSTNRFPTMKIYKLASEKIFNAVLENKTVVILCEGDPFFYGSFMYLFGLIRKRYNVEVIPGVSSLMASAAILETPLAAGNDILTVLPAPLADDTLEKQINMADAFAIIKLGRHFSRIRRLLEKLGLLENSVYIERATMKNERVVNIADVVESDVPYFSIILVHKRNKAWL